MVCCCFISNDSSPFPQNTNMTGWSFVSKIVVQKIELKRNQVYITGMLFMNRWFSWPRMENAKVALFVFIHCDSFSERRKLECEVYTLLFSLYNPQQKVAIYSSRKWIEAKHRNKSLRSLLIITRHFWLRAIPANSHACGLKTSISRRLTPAGQFLTPDWKMWVVAVFLDTISKNMLTQTHVRNGNHV